MTSLDKEKGHILIELATLMLLLLSGAINFWCDS